MSMNPAALMKLMTAKSKFEGNHPKFWAFLMNLFRRGVEEGAVIEITITHVDGTTSTGNMRVLAEDLELLQELKSIGGQQ